MVVALQHELLPRLVEGLLRDFAANTDAADYWTPTRMLQGPFMDNDQSIAPPQLFVAPLGGTDQLVPGVSGVQGNYLMRVLVGIFEPIRRVGRAPLTYTEHDRLGLLKRIIVAGTGGVNTGKILDPYSDGNPAVALNYLNTTMATFDDKAPILITQNARDVAALWSFVATFQTRIDNITLLRT